MDLAFARVYGLCIPAIFALVDLCVHLCSLARLVASCYVMGWLALRRFLSPPTHPRTVSFARRPPTLLSFSGLQLGAVPALSVFAALHVELGVHLFPMQLLT